MPMSDETSPAADINDAANAVAVADADADVAAAAADAANADADADAGASAVADAYPLLLIDAGNSRVKWEFRESDTAPPVRGALLTAWLKGASLSDTSPDSATTAATPPVGNVDSEAARSATLRAWQTLAIPTSIWISNVAGEEVATTLSTWLSTQWPRVPTHTIRAMAAQCGVTNHYLAPERLGSDRWAGMIGARAAYPDEALVIATLGTATTLDALNANGHFVGGLIAPGWALMMRALGEHTAQLPILSLGDAAAAQPRPTSSASKKPSPGTFAQATPDAIMQGCQLAQVGLITQAWHQWQDTLGMPVRCVLAGGAAADIGAALAIPHTRNDTLVLDGLARIATQQRASRTQ